MGTRRFTGPLLAWNRFEPALQPVIPKPKDLSLNSASFKGSSTKAGRATGGLVTCSRMPICLAVSTNSLCQQQLDYQPIQAAFRQDPPFSTSEAKFDRSTSAATTELRQLEALTAAGAEGMQQHIDAIDHVHIARTCN